jgi:methionyl-tRNA formyltransferase
MNLKFLYLGDKSSVYDYLLSIGETHITQQKITPQYISEYDWVVSYGYRHILKKHHILSSHNPILNLHISYLPWNKGADPNYWSWVENTPKGVTIHAIDEGIDTGDIFIQKKIEFEDNETLSSSYKKLKNEIENLFINNFENIIKGSIFPQKQINNGTLHYAKDFPGVESWDIKIKDLIK